MQSFLRDETYHSHNTAEVSEEDVEVPKKGRFVQPSPPNQQQHGTAAPLVAYAARENHTPLGPQRHDTCSFPFFNFGVFGFVSLAYSDTNTFD